MRVTALAQTLVELTEGKKGKDAVHAFEQFLSYLEARKWTRLLPRIQEEYETLRRRMTEQQKVVLTVAEKKYISKSKQHIPKGQEVTEQIDASTIGGYTVETKDALIDASYKRKLIDLYRSLF